MLQGKKPYLFLNFKFDIVHTYILYRKALQFYRGSDYDITEEINEIKEKRISKQQQFQSSKNSWKFAISRIFSMAFFRPFLGAGILSIVSILSGFNVVSNYMIFILQESGSSIDPNAAPIIIGSLGLIIAGVT